MVLLTVNFTIEEQFMQKQEIIKNLETGFNLSPNESAVAFALLEQRSKSLHFETVGDYVDAFYPKGFAVKDADSATAEHGFVEYLDSDVRSLIHTSSRADFPAFLRASAISFRHQMPEELKQQAESAFGVRDGKWSAEQTKKFAIGFEEYINYRFGQNDTKNIYERAEKFTENMHNRLSVLGIEADKMAELYDSFFTDKKWHFDETKYYQQVNAIRSKNEEALSNESIFLGMTAPIYQAAGFDRLPCVIDDISLKRTLDPDFFCYDIKHPDRIFKVPDDDTVYIAVTRRDENDNPLTTGIYAMKTDGQKNFISKITNEDALTKIRKAFQTNKVLPFNPLDEKASSFFRNPYSQGQDTSAFYKNDQLEMPLFNLDEEQDTKAGDLSENAQPQNLFKENEVAQEPPEQHTQNDLLLNYSDIKKLILDYGETNPKDIRQIQEVIFKSNYTDNGVPVSANHVIDVLGKDDFLRLIRRSAFHMSDSRENDAHLIIVDSGNIFEEDYTIHNNRYVTLTEKENFRYTENIEKIFNKRVSDVFNTYRDKIKSGKIKSSVGEVIFEGAVNNETIQLAAQAIVAEIDKSKSNEHTSHTNMAETPAQESTTTGNQEPSVEKQIQGAFEFALNEKADILQETELSRDNWNKYFPEGQVETPIETVKLGKSQFEKLQQTDREYLLDAMYKTLTNPSIVLGKETFDAKSEEFKPIHVYGKSFIRENSEHKKIIENIVVFKDDENISISTHNKDIGRFVKQIKTADQIIYADNEISRLASLYLNTGGSRVRLEGINTQVLNTSYNNDNFLSSGREQNSEAVPTLNPSGAKNEQTATAKIKIINNKELERVQLFFDNIPPEEQRAELKAHGWHWSPKNKAWQRKNTESALTNANEFAEKFYPEMQKATTTMQAETSAAQQTRSESAPEPKPAEADREHFHVAAGSDLQKVVNDLVVNKDYWIITRNETTPFDGKRYAGTIITKELIKELEELDQGQYEHNNKFGFNKDGSRNEQHVGYSKFFLEHIVNGESIQSGRINIGDGNKINREKFEYLYNAINATQKIAQEQASEKIKETQITGEPRELLKFDEFLSETAAARIKNIPELKGVIKEIEAKPLYQNDALFKFVKGGDFVITLARNYAEYKGLKVFDVNQEQEKLIALLQKNNIDVESYADWQKRITAVTPTHQSTKEEHANLVDIKRDTEARADLILRTFQENDCKFSVFLYETDKGKSLTVKLIDYSSGFDYLYCNTYSEQDQTKISKYLSSGELTEKQLTLQKKAEEYFDLLTRQKAFNYIDEKYVKKTVFPNFSKENTSYKEAKEKINEKDYWIVEFNETAFLKDYEGKQVTKELLDEVKLIDRKARKHNLAIEERNKTQSTDIDAYLGYDKFYVDHIVYGEVVEHTRVDIGDGYEANHEFFTALYRNIELSKINSQTSLKEKEPNITSEPRELIKFDEFLSETTATRIKNIPELKEVIKEIGSKPLYQNDALFKFVKGGDFIITLASDYAKYTGLKVFDATQEQEKLIALLEKNNIAVESYADWQKRITAVSPTHQSTNEEQANEALAPHTKQQIKDIRSQAKEILEKPDAEISEVDKLILSQYEGAGGINEKEKTTEGVLNEFYTPQNVIDKVWQIVDVVHPNAQSVLEPSSGIGKFARGRSEQFTMYEIDETSSRIAKLLYPEATIINEPYQKQFFDKDGRVLNKNYKQAKYDVVIGNPPYGAYTGKWKGLGEGKEFSRYEEYFISKGLDALKDTGVLAFVVPSSFLSSANDKQKEIIARKGFIVDAFRLPVGTFSTTDIGTDILLMKKYPESPILEMVKTTSELLSNSNYFADYPEKVLGEVKIIKDRFGKDTEKVFVHDGLTVQDELNKISSFIPEIKSHSTETNKTQKMPQKETPRKQDVVQDLFADNDLAQPERNVAISKKVTKKPTMSMQEFCAKYKKEYHETELKLQRATSYDGIIDTGKLNAETKAYLKQSKNYIPLDEKRSIHVENYCKGNVYGKLADLERESALIPKDIYEKRKAVLLAHKPEPIPFDKIDIPVLSTFSQEHNLPQQFIDWATGGQGYWHAGYSPIGSEELSSKVDWFDVRDYIMRVPVRAESVPYYLDPDKKQLLRKANKIYAEKKRNERREVAERLFKKFLKTLPDATKEKLEQQYNERFNAEMRPDYNNLPLFIDGMSATKDGVPFTLHDQQLKGVSFLCNKGNGLLAYDVGLGKTACGIVATVNQIQSGRAKRPLICVPKAVYDKWMHDTQELFPNIKVNDLGNFSNEKLKAFMTGDHGLDIAEGSISFCTNEALQHITFEDKTMNDLSSDIFDAKNDLTGEATKRDKAVQSQKLQEILGVASSVNDSYVLWENTGFDHITVDEAHRFKNLFTMPKPQLDDNGRYANDFSGIAAGVPSKRAQKLFAITQTIQKENHGNGVFLLTATPFTNSPLEVYSMMSFIAREKLKDLHLYNLSTFMTEFAETKSEWTVKANNDIEPKQVMKNFRKLPELQKFLVDYIDKVSADEANIERPTKYDHVIKLELNEKQKEIIADETQRLENGDKNSGDVLVAMNNMRMAVLSPALLTGDYKNVVLDSPKLKFVCDSVAQCYKQKPDGGQVIYMPRGIESFPYVKEYLVQQGVPQDAIALLSSKHNANDDKKDRIQDRFNDKNDKLKIIIGSDTISEGVDLNGNSFALYNTMLGWNPTESVQVSGRIHRQGNNQACVHIVYPVMTDSIDALMYQKHDEKSARIQDLFSFKGDKLEVQVINPEELKFDLIRDVNKKAKLIIDQKIKPIEKMGFYIKGKLSDINYINEQIEWLSEKQESSPEYFNAIKGPKNLIAFKAKAKKLDIDTTEKFTEKKDNYEKQLQKLDDQVAEIKATKDTIIKELRQEQEAKSEKVQSLSETTKSHVATILQNIHSRDDKSSVQNTQVQKDSERPVNTSNNRFLKQHFIIGSHETSDKNIAKDTAIDYER